jgi:hypothetical protein
MRLIQRNEAHPAQTARLDEVGIRGAHRVAVDALGSDAPAPAPLDGVIDGHHERSLRHEGINDQPQEDACPGSRRPRSLAEDAVIVHEVPLAAQPGDAQQARHCPLAWSQEGTDEQNLGVLPGAVDEERRKRDDDPGEAGR